MKLAGAKTERDNELFLSSQIFSYKRFDEFSESHENVLRYYIQLY